MRGRRVEIYVSVEKDVAHPVWGIHASEHGPAAGSADQRPWRCTGWERRDCGGPRGWHS